MPMISYFDRHRGYGTPISVAQRSQLTEMGVVLAAEARSRGDEGHTSGAVDYVVRIAESDDMETVPEPTNRGWFIVSGRPNVIDVIYQAADADDPTRRVVAWSDELGDDVLAAFREFRDEIDD